jgi:hypothetical protein
MLLLRGLAGLLLEFIGALQILGFGADGHPILANFQLNTAEAQSGTDKTVFAAATARREKLTWDQISERSAKMVSFIGKCLSMTASRFMSHCWTALCRSCWARAISKDDIIRDDVPLPRLCYAHGRS